MLITIILLSCFLLTCTALLFLMNKKNKSLSEEVKAKDQELQESKSSLVKMRNDVDHIIEEKINTFKADYIAKEKSDLSIKKALKKSEEANFLKNAFLSNISHEIRTPLNNIIGFSNLLEAEISLLENKELFEYARAISESGDRLLHLLNNIIDISKIEANDMQIKLQSCNITHIVANAMQLFIFKANEQRLKLNFIGNEVPNALVDEKSLVKVVGSIIDNAIKYTEKGFVNVTTDFLKDTHEISIRVKDSGVGIDPSYIPALFDPFRQESSGFSKDTQSGGLGLPLAKSLIDLMRGRIEIESVKGSGTTVTIYFPAEKTSQEDKQPLELTRKQKFKALQGLEIFIVEDDLMNKIVLCEMTKVLGNVVAAVNGDETLKIIEQTQKEGKLFDIMLFDINLPPPWDGIKLMQEIRKKWKAYRTIPFVAQTAYAMTGDKEKLLESGFDDYIAKPINQQELYSIIKNQLNKF